MRLGEKSMTNEMLYNQGFRTYICSSFFLAAPKLPFKELQSKIEALIECGTLRKDFVHFDEDEGKAIYFKYAFEEMKSFLMHHAYSFIEIKKPGRSSDSFYDVVWRLNNFLQNEKESSLIDSAKHTLNKISFNGIEEPHCFEKVPLHDRALQEKFLDDFYKKYNGIPIGEYHNEPHSKEFLIYHAQKLQSIGVNYLFLEHFSECLQKSLDEFFETGSMPQDLLIYVHDLDKRFDLHNSLYNFKALLFCMQKHGIKPIAIENTYSYAITGDLDGNSTKRMLSMNYLFKEKHDALLLEKPEAKWVSLTGAHHITTYCAVPGISEIVKRPSLLVSAASIELQQGAPIPEFSIEFQQKSFVPSASPIHKKKELRKRKAECLEGIIVSSEPDRKVKPR